MVLAHSKVLRSASPRAALRPMSALASCASFLDTPPQSPRLLLENAGFLLSAGLSLLVVAAVVRDPEDSIPTASGYVLMLCWCEILLAALSLTQLAVSRADCAMADAIYGVMSSLEMAAQLLALVSSAIIGMLIIEPFLPPCCAAVRVPLRLRTQMIVLAVICSLPALVNLGRCSSSPVSSASAAAGSGSDGNRSEFCPSLCGYSLNHVSPSEMLQGANQYAGVLLLLGTTLAAGL